MAGLAILKHTYDHSDEVLLRALAGWRSDPLFFDPIGALSNFRFSDRDNFSDKDVCSIVLELPSSVLGAKQFGVWARRDRAAYGGVR